MTESEFVKAFVAGAKWWEYHETEFTMWQSDQRLAEEEAIKRYASQQGKSSGQDEAPPQCPACYADMQVLWECKKCGHASRR